MSPDAETEAQLYNQLCFYTLAHGDPAFIHQDVVDAYAAQRADRQWKPIRVAFALIGLYLSVEKGFSGRQVQLVHMRIARRRRDWPVFTAPARRGEIGVVEVMAAPVGPARDEMIRQWCASVWLAWADSHAAVRTLLSESEARQA